MAILAAMAVLNQVSRLNDLESRIEKSEKTGKQSFSWKMDTHKERSKSEEMERLMDDIRHLTVRLQKIEDTLQKL